MKTGLIIFLLIVSGIANAQTLKDALYSGKLKTDTGTVIRKGEDLSSKIDSNRKKTVDTLKIKKLSSTSDSSIKTINQPQADSVKVSDPTLEQPAVAANDNVIVAKDNNKIWKNYMDSLITTFKTELLTNKKIKDGSYYVLVEYVIDIDGEVTINNVWPSPENSFLQQQIKERLTLSAPKLMPVLAGNGQPRKVTKKYNFTLTK